MIRGAQSSKRRKVAIRTVFFRDLLALATLTVLLSGCAGRRTTTPLARNGVLGACPRMSDADVVK